MCPPQPLRMTEPILSRAYSLSSGSSTLIGGNETPISPMSLPGRSLDFREPFSPVIQIGPDNRQWIDLEYVSPKLLRELRRQSAVSSGFDSNNSSLSKGAEKVKAWVRQGKKGIDIRLRRKAGPDRDEITDIHLVPHHHLPYPDRKVDPLVELPELPDAVCELPDTSITPELPQSHPRLQRPSSTATTVDTLPKYEPPQREAHEEDEEDPGEDPLMPLMRNPVHRRAASGTSIMPTPTRGLSVHKPDVEPEAAVIAPQPLGPAAQVQSLEASLDDTKRLLSAEQQQREHFEQLVAALQRKVSTQDDSRNDDDEDKATTPILRNFLVDKANSYETETDAEPQSPVFAKKPQNVRSSKGDKGRTKGPKKRNNVLASPPQIQERSSESDIDQIKMLLQRQSTIHDAVPPEAGAEAVWASILGAQGKMLGAEHPLIYQARHSLALSRSKQHSRLDGSILDCLHQSRGIGAQMLGEVHPLVLTFSKDLTTLNDLVVGESRWEGPASASLPQEVRTEDTTLEFASATKQKSQNPSIPSLHVESKEARQSPSTAPQSPAASTSPPTSAKTLKPAVPTIVTTFHPASKEPSPISANPNVEAPVHTAFDTHRPPHRPRSDISILSGLAFKALATSAIRGILWLQRNYGPEPPVELGKVRVRWTCACGEQLYDDFVEKRAGAARELEAYLNRPRAHTGAGSNPSTPSSANSSQIFDGSSGGPPSSQTSWASYGSPGRSTSIDKGSARGMQTYMNMPFPAQTWPPAEPPWLLTCANEDRYTPKLSHIDMGRHKITSDKDLALALRNLYFHVNRRWWRSLRLRGLSTIEFVQFEVHQNRFADIRKAPDMPTSSQEYEFEPSELMPPVGSQYLLHLFKHPEDYDGELITYLRAPKKKTGRLQIGAGYGINLVEGFETSKVWLLMSLLFAFGSIVFGAVWAWKRHDVQGAFGVAAWICTFAVLATGWLQACLG